MPLMETSLDGSDKNQLEILVLGQIRDSMALTNRTMERFGDKLEVVHTAVTELKSADIKPEFVSFKVRAEDRIRALEVQLARYSGVFVPLAVIGSGLFATVCTLVVQLIMKKP